MASTGEVGDAADRSLLEGAPTSSYGTATPAAPAAPAAASAAPGERPQLTPDELLRELTRNADVYKDMIVNYVLKSLAPLITEAVGTFVLVFTVGCAVTSPTPAPWAPVAISAVLTVMVYATWRISGANLNPAVTFALTLLGKKEVGALLGYWTFQFLGAFAAASTYKMVCAPHLAVVAPVPPFHAAYALAAEAIFTALLVLVVLSVCLKSSGPDPFFGLAIGFALLGSAYACGHISGAALNPAVAVALGFSGGQGYQWALCWFAAELGGAGVAAGLFWALRRETTPPPTGDTGAATAENPVLKRCAAEALGTFMLVCTVGLNIVAGSHATAYSAAAILMCMIYALGDLSGGHFNPAVTLAVLLGRGKISKPDAAKYMLTQTVAALLAALVYVAFHMGSAVAEKSIKLMPGHGYSVFQAGLGELVATFVLSYAVLAVATTPSAGPAAGLVVASALTAGSFAVGSVSGGELNPALVLALAMGNVVHPGKGGVGPVTSWLALMLCEFLGAVLAAGIFRFTHRSEFMPKEEEEDQDVKGLKTAAPDVEAQA